MAREYLVPDLGFINETGAIQYMVPGFGFIHETSPSGPLVAPVNLQTINVQQLSAQGLYVYRRKFPVPPDERQQQSQLFKRKFPKLS